MTQTLTLALINADQGRTAVKAQLLPYIGALIDQGKRVKVVASELEDERSLKQNAFYWAACLKDISEQASIGGQKWSADAWHELMKRQHLPRVVKKSKVAGKSRPVVSVSLGTTTGLSVRKMSNYLEKVQAFAATELGVTFTVAKWESYRV